MTYLCTSLFEKSIQTDYMLIIHVDHGESIDKALKRYKNKHRHTRQMDELKKRKFFTKPSIKRRSEVLKAAYRDKKLADMGS